MKIIKTTFSSFTETLTEAENALLREFFSEFDAHFFAL